MLKSFKTLDELYRTFEDNKIALNHFKTIRWRNGEFCPHCGHDKIYKPKAEGRYTCAQCHQRFSILVGTIFENTKLPLRIWFGAIWLLTNHPKGIASTTLARDLGITQKSAWFVLQRLRYAARTQSFNKPLTGIVEIDETYVGGKDENRRGKTIVIPSEIFPFQIPENVEVRHDNRPLYVCSAGKQSRVRRAPSTARSAG